MLRKVCRPLFVYETEPYLSLQVSNMYIQLHCSFEFPHFPVLLFTKAGCQDDECSLRRWTNDWAYNTVPACARGWIELRWDLNLMLMLIVPSTLNVLAANDATLAFLSKVIFLLFLMLYNSTNAQHSLVLPKFFACGSSKRSDLTDLSWRRLLLMELIVWASNIMLTVWSPLQQCEVASTAFLLLVRASVAVLNLAHLAAVSETYLRIEREITVVCFSLCGAWFTRLILYERGAPDDVPSSDMLVKVGCINIIGVEYVFIWRILNRYRCLAGMTDDCGLDSNSITVEAFVFGVAGINMKCVLNLIRPTAEAFTFCAVVVVSVLPPMLVTLFLLERDLLLPRWPIKFWRWFVSISECTSDPFCRTCCDVSGQVRSYREASASVLQNVPILLRTDTRSPFIKKLLKKNSL